MLAPEFFKKLRRSWFRMHYQFIMANDMRAPYEYMMLVCGPVPVEQWARRGHDMLARFAADATYRPLLEVRARDGAHHPQHEPRGSSRASSAADLVGRSPAPPRARPRISPS